jgi:hypothetical protein
MKRDTWEKVPKFCVYLAAKTIVISAGLDEFYELISLEFSGPKLPNFGRLLISQQFFEPCAVDCLNCEFLRSC